MKSTLLVLALAVASTAGCRAINSSSQCGQPCAQSCGDACCEPCHVKNSRNASRIQGCCEGCSEGCGCSRGGNLEASCPGGQGCLFDRYSGSQCGDGSHPGPYDCSPCDSPDWGCNGYRHPQGYVTPNGCRTCQSDPGCPGEHVGPHCKFCGHGYCCACCGPPAPGCPYCCCGASGDQNYNFNPGPPVAQTAYPYYTLRGPRDFLLDSPPSIGPY